MIFNGLRKTADLHFFFRGEEIKITITYGSAILKTLLQFVTGLPTLDQQGLQILSPS